MSASSRNVCTNCGHMVEVERIDIPSDSPTREVHTSYTSSSEVKDIQSLLLTVPAHISQLDSNIDRLQANLDELKRKREELQRFWTDHHNGLLSPARRLPPEILGEIFIAMLSDEHWSLGRQYMMAALLPGRVCRYWRNVALSTPRLWSAFGIDLGRKKLDTDVQFMTTWLARSAGCPLFFQIHSSSNAYAHPILVLIVAHAHRWCDVTFTIPSPMVVSLQAAKGRLLCLQTLSLQTWTPISDSPLPHFLNTFESAPRLRHVTIGASSSLIMIDLPWSQLTEFRMQPWGAGYTLDECLDILDNSPDLVVCDLVISMSTSTTTRRHLQHNQLRELKIETWIDPSIILDNLSLPALRHFAYLEGGQIWPQSSFLSFLRRSSCSLEGLVLACVHSRMSDDELIQCLEHVPHLYTLEIRNGSAVGVTKSFLDRLTYRPPGDAQRHCIVPKLQIFRTSVEEPSNYQAFASMVESRWRLGDITCGAADGDRVEQIQKIQLCCLNPENRPEDDEMQSLMLLKAFGDEGLDVSLEDMNGDDMTFEQFLTNLVGDSA